MSIIKKIWHFLGTSGAWLAMFLFIVIFEGVLESTLKGYFLTLIFLLGYFLSRIAEAIEAKNKVED
jgi:hypothetical protein